MLNGIVSGAIPDKFQAILAIDIAFALIHTFQESHEMTASNLMNMFIADEVKEALPEVLLTAVFSLVVHASSPYTVPPVYYTVLTNSLMELSKNIESMKKFKGQVEDLVARFLFRNIAHFKEPAQKRVCHFLAFLMSQTAGRDLGQTEPMLIKLTENEMSAQQEAFLRAVFAQLCKLCFAKKVWEQVDPKFHCYLPPVEQGQQHAASDGTAVADEPEMQLITDAILAKHSSEQLLEIIQNGQVFARAILNRTKKSLEHLKTSIERYRKVFDELFVGVDGQKQIISQVV